jgi:hypothetical protein
MWGGVLLVSLVVPALAFSSFFIAVGPMAVARSSFALVGLADGRVLAVGASPFERRTELYDPESRTFSTTGSLVRGRTGPTATLLWNSKVLIAGGTDSSFLATATAELYDLVTGTFSPTTNMTVPRANHTATLMEDGRVLVVGGHRFNFPNSALASAEVYDPATEIFTAVGNLMTARQDHTATLLADGKVLVAGGFGASQIGLTGAELYDPMTTTFSPTGSLNAGRGEFTATLLINGMVLVAGGYTAFPDPARATAELYDPATRIFSLTGSMTAPRGSHTASLLSDGRVLVAGGFTAFPNLGAAHQTTEVFDATSNSFVADASMAAARGRHASATLPGGDVIIAGGANSFGSPVLSAVLYTHDATPPTLTVPDAVYEDGTSPAGAVVTYSVTAVDDFDPNPTVVCSPASGSLFPLLVSTVNCTATDATGNVAQATFDVIVKDANWQLEDVIGLLQRWNLGRLGTSLTDKLNTAQRFNAGGKSKQACETLASLLREVNAQAGKGLTVEQALELTARVTRIRDVIGC